MNENYLDNLILTEYIHDVHILEEPFDGIPEVKKEVVTEKELNKELEKEQADLINLDINEGIKPAPESTINLEIEEETLTKENKALLEFDYKNRKQLLRNIYLMNGLIL